MKYQHRVLGMLSLLSVITYLDRVCIVVAGLGATVALKAHTSAGRSWLRPAAVLLDAEGLTDSVQQIDRHLATTRY